MLESDGLTTLEAGDGKSALDVLARGGVDLVLLDLEMKGISGLDVLTRIAEDGLGVAVIIVSGRGTIRTAVATTKLGAVDFIEKPYSPQVLLNTVHAVLERSGRGRRASSLVEPADRGGLIGSSMPMRRLLDQIARVARTDAKVLLVGESGTGKDLTARALHANGTRRKGPLVARNCAAIPEELIESELFGHERGAFTGAFDRHVGVFEQAHTGTLFLDEVGDMSLMTQVKVLRVIEERRVTRLRGRAEIPVDFRLITATHRDLDAAVHGGDFREDLYFRLNVIRIDVPSLRERREDIPELADHFLRRIAQEERVPPRSLTPGAVAILMAHEWAGNVRELRNVAERIVASGTEGPVEANEARYQIRGSRGMPEGTTVTSSLRDARLEFERAYIGRTLAEHEGRVQDAAVALGIDRTNLWRKMKQLGLATT
jgi:two-component system nitrogen regulation response regulator NtrX